MAKFSRVGPVWRKPSKPKFWKLQKAGIRRSNFFQEVRDSDPLASTSIEFITEDGLYLVLEQDANVYLVTEG